MLHDGAEIGAKGSPIPARAGIGLRFQHHQAVLDTHPAIGWFEIHPENYFAAAAHSPTSNACGATTPYPATGSGSRSAAPKGLTAIISHACEI